MAEIKSTLDIIMEKTRNLTLTDEEKKAFRLKEVKGKVRGLLMKSLDGLMDLKDLKNKITALDKKDPGLAVALAKKDCLERIDPETDNALILEILEKLVGLDISFLKTGLSEFHRKLDHEKAIREQSLTEQIHKKGISGSAVLPNTKADGNWGRFVQELKKTFREELQDLLQKSQEEQGGNI